MAFPGQGSKMTTWAETSIFGQEQIYGQSLLLAMDNPPRKVVYLSEVCKRTDNPPVRTVWLCNCDCITFRLYDDGAAVCAQCGVAQVGIRVDCKS